MLHRTKYAIWDIDNCVADDQWRTPCIDWHLTGNARYERYNQGMLRDPAKHVSEFNFLSLVAVPIFFTGRCEHFETKTRQWLAESPLNVPAGPLVMMRGSDDQSKPADLKEKMLRRILALGIRQEDIIAAFDDMDPIVEMYRSYGIDAHVLKINDLSKAYEPADFKPATTHTLNLEGL